MQIIIGNLNKRTLLTANVFLEITCSRASGACSHSWFPPTINHIESTNTARKKGTQSWLRLCGPQYYDKNVEIYLAKVNKTYLLVNQISTSATRIAWLSAESVFVFVLFLLKKDNTRKYMGLKIANKQNLRKYKNVRVNRFSKTNLRSVATSRKKRCEQKKTARDMIEKAVLLNFYMQVTNHRTNGRV